MNAYSTAAFKVYGSVSFVFFFLPVISFASMVGSSEAIYVILWGAGVFIALIVSSMGFAGIHSRKGGSSWSWSLIQSILILLVAAAAAGLPAFWGLNHNEFFIIAGWVLYCGIMPTIIAGVLYKGATERLTEMKAEQQGGGSRGDHQD